MVSLLRSAFVHPDVEWLMICAFVVLLHLSSGGYRLHRLQRGSQVSWLSPLHQSSGSERVPLGHLVRGQRHPGLWQVHMSRTTQVTSILIHYCSFLFHFCSTEWNTSCNHRLYIDLSRNKLWVIYPVISGKESYYLIISLSRDNN